MIDPDDAHHQETNDVSEVRRPFVAERSREAAGRDVAPRGNVKIQDQQGDRDRKDAVAECLEPPATHDSRSRGAQVCVVVAHFAA